MEKARIMGLGDFWLQSNNGKRISLDNLKELKKSDLKNNPELMKLFDFFNTNKSNGSEEVLDKQELNSLFNTFSNAAQSQKGKNTSIFETSEAEDYINSNQSLQELNIKVTDLFDFLSRIVKPRNEQKTLSEPIKKTKTNQKVKARVIESLRSDSDETLKIISNMNNGDISDIYDSVKTFLDMDTSKAKVLEAAVNQAQGAKYMEQAESGGLTREEYIKANKQRLQDMMKARLYKKDKNGIDYLDKNRADLKMSRKEFEALMLATIERMTDDMDIKSIKEKIRQLPMTTEKGDRFLMDSIKQNAVVLFGKAKSAGCSTLDLATKYIYDTTKIVKPNPDDKKLLTFDEVFYYEQGVNYSKEDCEKYLDVQTQLTKNLSSYNKYLEFKTGANKILKEKDAEKALNNVIKLFEQFYSDPSYPNLAYKNLKSVVKNSNLPINVTQDETGRISISMVSGSEDLLLSYVSDILAAEGSIQQERLDKVFGGNAEEKLEELQKEVEQAHEKAYGNDFSSTLGKAMIEDNQTFIQRYTGNASMTGMGLTVVGGVLCFTPAAALGAVMVTAGNTLAISGMAAESGLGFYEASTRKHGAEDGEYEELTKTMLMNLGGFGFGGAAGKTGMKLFNKFVSKELDSLPKLSEAFKSAMVKGNRAEALKIVCSQPEYRKQFAKGLASKLLSDFSISYAGDLVMMGVLDTQDDWESLLQSNLIGILAGMGGDIKDAAHLGMKGDKYRALKKKEQDGTITEKEIKELALLRQDADIRNLSGENEGVNEGVNEANPVGQVTPDKGVKDVGKKEKESNTEIVINNDGTITIKGKETKANADETRVEVHNEPNGGVSEHFINSDGVEGSIIYKDHSDRVIKSKTFMYDDLGNIKESIENTYNESGFSIIKEKKDANGNVFEIRECEYDETGTNRTKEVIKDGSGHIIHMEEYVYVDGKLAETIITDKHGNKKIKNYRNNADVNKNDRVASQATTDKNPAQKAEDGKSTSSQTDAQASPQHIVVGNKLFELNSKFMKPTKDAIEEVKAEIERLSKTEPEKADNLQIVLDKFTTPTEAKKVTKAQIDAVVKYLDEHYRHKESYLTTQVKKLGLNILGKFGNRMKGLESTRDKVANYIADAIKDENEAIKKGENFTPKTLLDAYNDVRDKYACRTVFEMGDYTKAPTVANLINEAKALKLQGKIKEASVKMHEAELKAAELQSKDVAETIKQSILKAKENDADLNLMRISNYVSPDGIPILSESQLSEIKYFAAQQGINVEFIRLASEIDPSLTPEQRKEQEKKLTTKSQPSGYTALQINFVTKSGEVIEWQFRGELVDRFAEAEHLPYDLRTGKHPWKQIPELEPLYKPIADLLDEDVMPKHAYKQINRYFTDYYTHLRRLELGFDSEEPKLSDYENYRAKDENGVERNFTYKFDKRLEAKNLIALHDYAEGIKDGLVTPERAVVELNREIGFEEQTVVTQIELKRDVQHNEKIDMDDIKSITKMVEDTYDNHYATNVIVNAVKYKYQIPILKRLLECNYKKYNGEYKRIDEFDITLLLPKLKDMNDVETIISLYEKYGTDRSWIRVLTTNIDSPYFNLLNKIFEYVNMNDSTFDVLRAEFDTPEKIKQAEEAIEKLPMSAKLSGEAIVKALAKEVNGFDFDKNIKTITERVEQEYGEGTVQKYLNNRLFYIAQKAKTPLQRGAIAELLKYKDEKYFIYPKANRYDIEIAIEEVLNYIKTPNDIKIVKAMFDAKIADNIENEIFVSGLRYEMKKIFEQEDTHREYLSFVADKSRNFYSGEDVLEAMQYAQNIHNLDMVPELQQYFMSGSMYKYKSFIDLANDSYKLEGIKVINKFNKNKSEDNRLEVIKRDSRTTSPIEYITDQSSLDYFKVILDFYKTNNQDRLSYLMEIADNDSKRTAVKMLLDYQNKDGSKIINTSTQIEKAIRLIDNETDVQKLSEILTKKRFGFFERTLSFNDVVEELSINPNIKTYAKTLKQKYPNIDVNKVLQYVKDDSDFNLALKFIEKNRMWDVSLISEARKNDDLKQALDYILDTNTSLLDYIGKDNLKSMKNVYEKVKMMNDAGISFLPYEDFKKLKENQFFTKSYLKDTKDIKDEVKINQFKKDTPTEQILAKVSQGEICTIDGVLHIRENDRLVKLNISLQTYAKLFPRQDRFGTKQGGLGDCWLISTMDVLMSSPTGRSKLLQLFSEKDGTVYVTLPGEESIPFKDGKPISTDHSTMGKHADACTGIRLLEEATAFVCSNKKVEDFSSLADLEKMMDSIVGGDEERGFRLLLGKNGELPSINNVELFEEILVKYSDNSNAVLRTGINGGINIPREIADKYNLVAKHAYRIDGYDKNTKTVFVVNPHDTRFRIELPLDIYKTYFSDIKILEFNE